MVDTANPVLSEEQALLKVYRRRLHLSDNKFDKGRAERLRFLARYRNETETDQINEEGHVVSVTSGIGIIDTMYSSMTAVDVEFIANHVGHGSALQSLVATRALNQAWRDTKGQKRAKDAVKDSLLVDIGWVKVYYDYLEEKALQDVPSEALAAQITTLASKYGVSPEEVPEEELDMTEAVDIVIRDRVCIEYVPWDMIRPDPTAKRIEDVRWVAQYSYLPVHEVQNNPLWAEYVTERYGKRKGRDLLESIKGDTQISNHTDPELFTDIENDEYSDDTRVTVCEMWDFETGLVTVFPKSRTDVILHQRENPLMFNADLEDRNPFKPLVIRKDNQSLEGLGDMRVIWPALQEMDEYRSNLATHIARTIPKVLGPEEGLTQKGKDALKSPVWGEFVGTQGVDGNAYQPLIPPPLPQEAFALPDRIQVEMKEGTGVSEPMRGVFPSKRTTATETQIVTDRGDQRQAERRSALEEWYLSIARTMLQLMQVYYEQDRMLRYTDETGAEFEWDWNYEDIAIEADIDISITPRENLTRDQRVQRLLLLMNLALPLPETDRAGFLRLAALEMGYREEDVRPLIKSQEEVQAEQQLEQAQQLGAAAPPPFANSPQGLNIG